MCKEEALLQQMYSMTPYVKVLSTTVSTKVGTTCTTNPEQTEVMEIEHVINDMY